MAKRKITITSNDFGIRTTTLSRANQKTTFSDTSKVSAFRIAGTWDGAVVTLSTKGAEDNGPWFTTRLARDVSFELPMGTKTVRLRVSGATGSVSLVAEVEPVNTMPPKTMLAELNHERLARRHSAHLARITNWSTEQ